MTQKNQIQYQNQLYSLNLAFPLVFKCFDILNDEHLDDDERLELSLFCFIGKDVEPLNIPQRSELLNKIFDQFIYTKEDKRRAELTKHQPQAFDFEQDQDLIYSAVLQQYGIDLTDEDIQKSLTWKQFNSLINGLNDDTFFRKVTMYRTVKIDKDKMSKEQQQFLKEMKTLYGLHEKEDEHGFISDKELALIVAPLNMTQKVLKIKELRDTGKLPKPGQTSK